MRTIPGVIALFALALSWLGAADQREKPAEEEEPLRVFIRAGKKTHRPGAHEHERFLVDWTKLLRERGAEVDGALTFPSAEQIANCDVIVNYAANAGNITEEQRKLLKAFQERGGGLVFIHDAVCSDHHDWFKTVTGGAWEHKHSRFFEGVFDIDYTMVDHPITEGAGDFKIEDEIYWDLHMMDESKILACTNCEHAPGSPQMWAYEAGQSRVFSSIPGHWYATFSLPQYRAILLRGIAWAGDREVDNLTLPEEVAALKAPKDALDLREKSVAEAEALKAEKAK